MIWSDEWQILESPSRTFRQGRETDNLRTGRGENFLFLPSWRPKEGRPRQGKKASFISLCVRGNLPFSSHPSSPFCTYYSGFIQERVCTSTIHETSQHIFDLCQSLFQKKPCFPPIVAVQLSNVLSPKLIDDPLKRTENDSPESIHS